MGHVSLILTGRLVSILLVSNFCVTCVIMAMADTGVARARHCRQQTLVSSVVFFTSSAEYLLVLALLNCHGGGK